MAPDSMVVEDGVDERSPRGRSRSSWPLVGAAFVLGLTLGSVASSPSDPGREAETSADSTLVEPEESSRDEHESGISNLVPGFPDALVAVDDGIGSGHDHLLWPVRGPLVTRSMTGGDDVSLDATGQFVALSEQVPGLEGVVLSIGRFNGIRPVSSAVTSFVWHDSRSGELAFTSESDGEWLLHRVAGNFSASVVAAGPEGGRSVAAWGDWGFALRAQDGEVVLLTPSGEPKAVEPGLALASHPSGWLLVEDDGLKLVSAGGGVRRLDLEDVPAPVFAAAFSPDGDRVAVAGRLGIAVYDLAAESRLARLSGYPGGWLAWSSDSRFVLAPAPSGIFVHDLQTGESVQTLVGRNVVTAQVLPLSTS